MADQLTPKEKIQHVRKLWYKRNELDKQIRSIVRTLSKDDRSLYQELLTKYTK